MKDWYLLLPLGCALNSILAIWTHDINAALGWGMASLYSLGWLARG